jgi:hypothetical protein
MKPLLAALMLAAPLAAPGGPCNEACIWVKIFGSAGYACVNGGEGRSCVSTGYVCSIITSCRVATVLGPGGTVLAIHRNCPTDSVAGPHPAG